MNPVLQLTLRVPQLAIYPQLSTISLCDVTPTTLAVEGHRTMSEHLTKSGNARNTGRKSPRLSSPFKIAQYIMETYI